MKRYHIELDVHLGGTVAVEDINGAFCYHADAEAEVARLLARLAKLEAVREEAVNLRKWGVDWRQSGLIHAQIATADIDALDAAISACDEKPPAPVCKHCDGIGSTQQLCGNGMSCDPEPCVYCTDEPAPKEEPDGNA